MHCCVLHCLLFNLLEIPQELISHLDTSCHGPQVPISIMFKSFMVFRINSGKYGYFLSVFVNISLPWLSAVKGRNKRLYDSVLLCAAILQAINSLIYTYLQLIFLSFLLYLPNLHQASGIEFLFVSKILLQF